jgi:hypothetical protein
LRTLLGALVDAGAKAAAEVKRRVRAATNFMVIDWM